jgi:hypothetical protein
MAQSWNELVELSLKEMEQKQKSLPPSDPASRWDADQDSGTFTMTDANGSVIVKARIQFVGTYSATSQSWLWSWANRSIDFANRSALEVVRRFGQKYGWRRLTDERVPCSWEEATHLWAVAVHAMSASAGYRFELSPTSAGYLALFELITTSPVVLPAHGRDRREATGSDDPWEECASWHSADPWDALIIRIEDVQSDPNEYLESWKWLLKETFEPLAVTAFGDWFLRDRDGRIHRLSVAEGQIVMVANTLVEFHQVRAAPGNIGNWFMPALVAELRKTGKILDTDVKLAEPNCYSYVIPPFLGGSAELKNIRVLPLSVHMFFWGSVCQRLQALPPGTRVRRIDMDSAGKIEVDFIEPMP